MTVSAEATGEPQDGQGSVAYRCYVLGALLLMYITSYVDRVLAGIAMPAIRDELHLSDAEIGLITGAAFSVPFVLCSVPLGLLADRTVRIRVIAGAVAVWSVGTAAFGAGRDFIHLFLARAGVGAGEAGGNAPAVSILIDYFPRRQLGRVMSIYGFGTSLGTALGVYIGANLVSSIGWRETFFLLGGISLLLALFLLTIREPKRRQDADAVSPALPWASVRMLLTNPSYMLLVSAVSIGAVATIAIFFWLPSMFVRSFNISVTEFAAAFGTLHLVGGLAGSWIGGYISDRIAKRTPAAYVGVTTVGYLVGAIALAIALSTPSLMVAYAFLFIATLFQSCGHGPIVVAYQRVIAPEQRATAAALLNSVLICLSMGIGLPLLGLFSDLLKSSYGEASLGTAMLILPLFYIIAALLFGIEARRTVCGQAPSPSYPAVAPAPARADA